jgi:hypothetical protein
LPALGVGKECVKVFQGMRGLAQFPFAIQNDWPVGVVALASSLLHLDIDKNRDKKIQSF